MTAVVESDCCSDKRSAELHLRAAWVEQPVAKGAAQGTQVLIQGVGGIVQGGPECSHHSPLIHYLKVGQGAP